MPASVPELLLPEPAPSRKWPWLVVWTLTVMIAAGAGARYYFSPPTNEQPIGLTMARAAVADKGAFGNISTFGASPPSMAAASATISVIEEEKLLFNSQLLGKVLREGLQGLAERFQGIGDVRGMGLMQAIELVKDRGTKEPDPQTANKLMETTKKRGLLVGKGGLHGNTMRIAPPMTVSKGQIDDALRLCLLLADQDPARFDRAVLRWLERFIAERLPPLVEIALAASAFAELRHGDRRTVLLLNHRRGPAAGIVVHVIDDDPRWTAPWIAPRATFHVGNTLPLRRQLRFAASCDKACLLTADLRLDPGIAGALHVERVVAERSVRLAAGARRSVDLRLDRRALKLLRARGRAAARLVVVASDEHGHDRTVIEHVTLVP